MSDSEIDKAVKEAAEFEAQDKKRKEAIDARNDADSMVSVSYTHLQTPVKEQTICSVDLGINTDAVCTIMRPDGTGRGICCLSRTDAHPVLR